MEENDKALSTNRVYTGPSTDAQASYTSAGSGLSSPPDPDSAGAKPMLLSSSLQLASSLSSKLSISTRLMLGFSSFNYIYLSSKRRLALVGLYHAARWCGGLTQQLRVHRARRYYHRQLSRGPDSSACTSSIHRGLSNGPQAQQGEESHPEVLK